jgi:hypothetical protein
MPVGRLLDVSVTFDFQPLGNGMDFLESAIAHLQDDDEPRNLKYAVLHLQAAAGNFAESAADARALRAGIQGASCRKTGRSPAR